MSANTFFETTADVVVVGGGSAALAALYELRGLDVVVVHPRAEHGSSALARGGIAAALQGDAAEHVEDTVVAGAGLCNRRRVELLVAEGRDRVQALIEAGMPFDLDARGELSFGLEAGHSRPRIVHAGGDATGRELVKFLAGRLGNGRSPRRIVGTVEELLRDSQGRVAGVVTVGAAGTLGVVRAPDVVLATGGIGALFSHSSNAPSAVGAGLVLAARAGAWLIDLEFVQFHPTALDITAQPMPLMTEALRGAGARLVTSDGTHFLDGVHPDADLAPRDIVARAVWRHISQGKRAFLDTRGVAELEARFPSVALACAQAGIDTALIPVAPAAHYHMGGIEVDDDGGSSVEGLWACGEVASTGVHGANRLASNSLLEALVFGARVGITLANRHRAHRSRLQRFDARGLGERDTTTERWLRDLCWDVLGVERDGAVLTRALSWLETISILAPSTTRTGGQVLLARMLATSALRRQESRGAHHRLDFPHTDPLSHRLRMAYQAGTLRSATASVNDSDAVTRPERPALRIHG